MTDKPSHNEDEYFLKQDAEFVKTLRAKLDADRQSTERKSHFMLHGLLSALPGKK